MSIENASCGESDSIKWNEVVGWRKKLPLGFRTSSSGADHNQSVFKYIPGVKSKQSTISFRYSGHIIP